ncbi:hypothetical protein [Rhodobacter ferrooxidans]|uniref:Uncharacterized protein n=1 Tax=Rhodobacter ferrooxidans TaxID=371731 RepID=C8RZ43_9RHOB|nr:hypothetical protein [Rhodobacter sp. SW2]EEW26000.1 hypothetical protein Rsw2DRAFT_1071 [Rhodobacter sp. SW2]
MPYPKVSLALCLVFGVPALAATEPCLTHADLAAGIQVSTEDGRVYQVKESASGKKVEIQHVWTPGDTGFTSVLVTRMGLYLLSDFRTYFSPPSTGTDFIVGGHEGTEQLDRFKYANSAFPQPQPGSIFASAVRITHDFQSPSTGPQETEKYKVDAVYSFLAEQSVSISKCDYRMIPVEVTMAAQGETFLQRRQLYFPDLGFSVITATGDDAYGQAGKNGITGFARQTPAVPAAFSD